MASWRLHLTLPLATPGCTCSPLPSSSLTISVLFLFQGNCQGSRGQRTQGRKWLCQRQQCATAQNDLAIRSPDFHTSTLHSMASAYSFLTFFRALIQQVLTEPLHVPLALCWPLGIPHWAKCKLCPQGVHRIRKGKLMAHESLVWCSLGASKSNTWTNWGYLGKISWGVGAWDYLEES